MAEIERVKFVPCEAEFAVNSGPIDKNSNEAGRKFCRSLRSRRQGAIRCVEFPRRRPTMPSEMRLAADPLAARYYSHLYRTLHSNAAEFLAGGAVTVFYELG